MKHVGLILLLAGVLGCAGCSTLYYNTMEKLGVHKREIVVTRVKEAQKSQQDAKVEFKSALEEFTAVVAFKGGDLQAMYDKLSARLEQSEEAAKEVSDRIDAVEDVSDALFREWKQEIGQYQNKDLRRISQREYDESRAQYKQLSSAMRQAESKIEPVLAVMRDQVLFIKHNLNAKALASLKGEVTVVEGKVAALLEELEDSINEADVFIKTMTKE